MLFESNLRCYLVLFHFDLLYIGQDPLMWDFLQSIADENELSILKIKNTIDVDLIKDDFSFTCVLSDVHLDYNYEGFTIDKTELRYSYIGIITDEIEDSIVVSNSPFKNQEKSLLLKNTEVIRSFLQSKPMHIKEQLHQIPVEA